MNEPGQGSPFTIVREQDGRAQIVVVDGEIDLASAGDVDGALQAAEAVEGGAVVLDLMGVEFIDSTGLRVVLASIRRLTEQARALTVACPEGPVRRLFELTALTGQFALYDSRAAALASVA